MKVVFGCDPNATDFKNTIMKYAESLGYEVFDMGSDDPIYANVAIDCAKAVAAGKYDRGILLCGTGIGVSIAANKVKGIRCALLSDVMSATSDRFIEDFRSIHLFNHLTRYFTLTESRYADVFSLFQISSLNCFV